MCIFCLSYISHALFLIYEIHLLIFGFKQMGKIPVDEIKKDLKSAQLSEVAIEELLQVLSIKSLTLLEGWSMQ